MTQLKISNKPAYINNFLSPLGKLTENAVVRVRENEYNAISSSNDGTLIINCSIAQDNDVSETIFLNIPDISKLIKVLNCIQPDEISLDFNNNNIEYKSTSIGFKYHLLEDGIIDPPAVDINKIKNIDFPVRFSVTYDAVNQLIKGSTFTTDTNKIYIHTKDGVVNATLTDRQRHNVDSYSQQISETYKGPGLDKELALNFETLRIISSIRFDKLKININPELNVFLFLIEHGPATITVVSSGFVG